MKKLFLVICFNLLFCSSVFANSGFYNTKISAIVVHDYWNAIIIEFSTPAAGGENCETSSAVILKKDHYMFKEMYAGLLSAFHGKKMISGWANGCQSSYPILTRLDIRH